MGNKFVAFCLVFLRMRVVITRPALPAETPYNRVLDCLLRIIDIELGRLFDRLLFNAKRALASIVCGELKSVAHCQIETPEAMVLDMQALIGRTVALGMERGLLRDLKCS